jgi:chromosome segregation ATPase
MKTKPIPLSLAFTMLLGAAAAQESVTVQKLLVSCRGGIDMHSGTWLALIQNLDLRPLLSAEQATWVNRCTLQCSRAADVYGRHLVEIHTGSPRDLTADQQQALEALAVRWIEQRLNAVFHDPHRDRLQAEITSLRVAWDKEQSLLAESVQEPLQGMAQSLQQRDDRLREQQSEVRITLATEARARDFVRERLQVQDKAREDLEQRHREVAEQKNALQQEAEALRVVLQSAAQQPNVPDAILQQRDRMRGLESVAAKLDHDLKRLQRDLEQVFRQSVFFHEQLPTVELTLLRAEARQQVLAEQEVQLAKERAEFQARLRQYAERSMHAERKRQELRPVEQRLDALQRRLAELEPVRVEVLPNR